MDALSVRLPFDHHRVSGGGKGKGDGPRHRGDVDPHLAARVEFRVDEFEGLLEGLVVVVHVGDDEPLGFRSEQVLRVLSSFSARLREYSTLASLPTAPSSRMTRSTSSCSRTSGAMSRSYRTRTGTMWVCICERLGR